MTWHIKTPVSFYIPWIFPINNPTTFSETSVPPHPICSDPTQRLDLEHKAADAEELPWPAARGVGIPSHLPA
jgi:hypothetical protein